MSRKSIALVIASVAVPALFIAASSAWMVIDFTPGLCENTVIVKVPSPDGKLEAYVFERGCGATTGESTQVSILLAGENLSNEAGNVCVIDASSKVEVRWAGNKELIVTHYGGAVIIT